MINRKVFFITAWIILNCLALQAQKVIVTKDAHRVKGDNVDGYSSELAGTLEEITNSYTRYLKSFSKIKTTDKIIYLSDVTIDQAKYTWPLYAATKGKADKTTVWLGVNPSEWLDTAQYNKVRNELAKLVYNFGVKFYRDIVQEDIDEATRAQQAAEKQTQRLINESKNLNSRLEFNQKEKIRLEKALIDNKVEYETLLLTIANNKKSQDSLSIATEQIKKMVEIHKERQRKVN